jgi:hypothetical protein
LIGWLTYSRVVVAVGREKDARVDDEERPDDRA